MLPEPDLFSSVNINTHNPSDAVLSVLADTNTNTIPDLTHLCENDKSESPKQSIKLQCHPYSHPHTLGVNRMLSNVQQTNSSSSRKRNDLQERISRRWYLIVIVLLYAGMITSFCLNVTLLMKSYPEPSASRVSLSTNKIHSKGSSKSNIIGY